MSEQLKIIKGDITELSVDAIVNAANSSLLGGGGIDGIIHLKAGPDLLKECKQLGGCLAGHAKITKAYNLPAKWIIHTVGPVWRGGSKGEPQLLSACYQSSFNLALKQGIKTIALPAISCGVYGYPILQAAAIAIHEALNFLELHPDIERITFVCFDDAAFESYQLQLDAILHE